MRIFTQRRQIHPREGPSRITTVRPELTLPSTHPSNHEEVTGDGSSCLLCPPEGEHTLLTGPKSKKNSRERVSERAQPIETRTRERQQVVPREGGARRLGSVARAC